MRAERAGTSGSASRTGKDVGRVRLVRQVRLVGQVRQVGRVRGMRRLGVRAARANM